MKNIRSHRDTLEGRWRTLPIRKQRRCTLYFFVGYLLFTTVVVFKISYDAESPDKNMVIEHIENPLLEKNESPAFLQDTLQ